MAKGYNANQERLKELNSFGKDLAKRAKSKCELCTESTSLLIFEVPPVSEPDIDRSVMICEACQGQLENPETINPNHWHCLNETIWSEIPAVQVLAWRVLNQLTDQGWASDILEQLYIDEAILAWAKDGIAGGSGSDVITKDSNGATLSEGDSVTLIKDLAVKGTSFTAKRGTLVKNIHLIDDPANIEGKVNKIHIVLKTEFLKKV